MVARVGAGDALFWGDTWQNMTNRTAIALSLCEAPKKADTWQPRNAISRSSASRMAERVAALRG